MQVVLHIRTGFFEAVAHLCGGGFKFLFGFAQLFQFDLGVEFLLDAADEALQLADKPSGGAGGFGQTLGAEYNQGDDAD